MTATATKQREVTLFVPGVLWSLNKERSMHFHEHGRMTKAMRKAGKEACEALAPEPFSTPVVISAWPRTFSGRGDAGGFVAACKAAIDGAITDAQLLPNDGPKWVKALTMFLPRTVPMKDQGLLLVFRSIDESEG